MVITDKGNDKQPQGKMHYYYKTWKCTFGPVHSITYCNKM